MVFSVNAQPDASEVRSASPTDSHLEEPVGTAFDRAMMQRCLALARRALGRTAPNPLVGSVIVQAGEIVGRGFIRVQVSLMLKYLL